MAIKACQLGGVRLRRRAAACQCAQLQRGAGQRREVHVTYFIGRDTLDERMWRSVHAKIDVVGQTTGGGSSLARSPASGGQATAAAAAGPARPTTSPYFAPSPPAAHVADGDDDDGGGADDFDWGAAAAACDAQGV